MLLRKAFFAALLLVLVAGGLNTTVKAEAPPRATWLWNTLLIESKPDEIILFLKENNADQVFLQINRNVNAESYKRFIAKASDSGIKVHALDGAPDWAAPNGSVHLDLLMTWLGAYQASAAVNERFTGIHLDVEPYLYSGWTSNYKATVYSYQKLLLSAKSQAAGHGLPLGADMAFWFDEKTYNNKIGRGNLADWIIKNVDYPTIMAYRDTSAAIADIVSNELRMAAAAGKTLTVGVETGQTDEGNFISFYEEGKAYMEAELASLQSRHGGNLSIAIHHLDSWMNMKP